MYLYVLAGRFSKGEAFATRTLSFCKILKSLNKDVIVLSLDEIEPFKINIYKGFKYCSLRYISNTLVARVSNFLFFRNRVKKAIHLIKEDYKIEGIIVYDIPAHAFLYLKKYSKHNRIKIFHDSVEWYSPQQFKFGRFALAYILKCVLNRYIINSQVFVISISRYLKNYFESKNIRSIRIPVLMDMNEIDSRKKLAHDKLLLVYAGSPGRKDYLREIIEAISNLSDADIRRIEFNVFGVDEIQLMEKCLVTKELILKCGKSIKLHGRVSRGVVFEFLKQANFTVLLRSPNLRYAKAGFPTKVVESLAAGTPIICNITSDLKDYLIDHENSLLVEGCSSKSFEDKLRVALALTYEERQSLCLNARRTAERNFDYNLYRDCFNNFLNENIP